MVISTLAKAPAKSIEEYHDIVKGPARDLQPHGNTLADYRLFKQLMRLVRESSLINHALSNKTSMESISSPLQFAAGFCFGPCHLQ